MTLTDPELPHPVVKDTKSTSVGPDKQVNPVIEFLIDNHKEENPWGLTTELFAPLDLQTSKTSNVIPKQLILMHDEETKKLP